jgi:hypothetical protein
MSRSSGPFRAYLNGGSSYSCADWFGTPDALPASLAAAREVLGDVLHDPYYPCISPVPAELGGPELVLFHAENTSDYPDYIVSFGPRGGIRVSRT